LRRIFKISGLSTIVIIKLLTTSCEKYKIVIPIEPPSFNPSLTYGKLIDVDSNEYKTINIGTQVWMAENLRSTKYIDSSNIPLVLNNSVWTNLTTSGFCWYNNDEATYKNVFGALYNGYAVKTGKLCPSGWHVPLKNEWMILAAFVDDNGGKLKEVGFAHWDNPNRGATNESGFTALGGGFRSSGGIFYSFRQAGFWWSATECTECIELSDWIFIDYWDFSLGAWSSGYGYQHDNMLYGYSIRCIKDNL
jgi:uncharacterized protein (TIGR02145 family)